MEGRLQIMLTSTKNPRIQWVRSLQAQAKARREAGLFVVEGVRLVEEALRSGWQPELLLYTEDLSARGRELVSRAQAENVPRELVSPAVMKAAADTESPQGILAVLPARSLPLPERPDLVLILDQLRDPGNLGTILRTAAAASVQAVILSAGSADVYSPKVVRAGMGAHFRLPLQTLAWAEIRGYLQRGGIAHSQIYLADVNAGTAYTQVDFRTPLALIIGSEAEGAGEAAHQAAGVRIHIAMPGSSESLNAGAAAAVLLFEVVRQRSEGAPKEIG
jgi:RNA methyltransferase, TrmH family